MLPLVFNNNSCPKFSKSTFSKFSNLNKLCSQSTIKTSASRTPLLSWVLATYSNNRAAGISLHQELDVGTASTTATGVVVDCPGGLPSFWELCCLADSLQELSLVFRPSKPNQVDQAVDQAVDQEKAQGQMRQTERLSHQRPANKVLLCSKDSASSVPKTPHGTEITVSRSNTLLLSRRRKARNLLSLKPHQALQKLQVPHQDRPVHQAPRGAQNQQVLPVQEKTTLEEHKVTRTQDLDQVQTPAAIPANGPALHLQEKALARTTRGISSGANPPQ